MPLYPNDDDAYGPAKKLVRALGGQWHGGYGVACCPAHDDTNPSLNVTQKNGRVLFYCHAGCSQHEVLSALGSLRLHIGRPREKRDDRPSSEDEGKQQRLALEIWNASEPGGGTLVERYLRSREITLPVPDALRFHPSLKHPSGRAYPAMVALVTHGRTGRASAVHRTFLAPDGTKKAPVAQQKLCLGPCRGGAIRLAPATEIVMVAEGIETALSAMQVKKWPAWAALSASFLRTLELPPEIRNVIVLADGDAVGIAAASHAASRWDRQGRSVPIVRPPHGLDINDILCGSLRRSEA
jgi:putative DNA primase/helicase